MRRRTAAVPGILLVAAIAVQASLTSAVDVAGPSARISAAIDGETDGPSGEPLLGIVPAPIDVSADGRYIAFHSDATNLVELFDANEASDVFVHDTVNGTTVLVSISTEGEQGNASSQQPRISSDGRFVVFQSEATNLDPLDGNDETDVFIHDRDADRNEVFDDPGGTATVRISIDGAGEERLSRSVFGSVSDDGRYVSFQSNGSFVDDDTNGFTDVYVHDRDANDNNEFDEPGAIATIRVSVATDGTEGDTASTGASLSGDGRFVVFASDATTLVPEDANEVSDIFVHDRDADEDGVFDQTERTTTVRVGLSTGGDEPDADALGPVMSGDGRFVAFESAATTLFDGDADELTDVFLRDRDSDGNGVFDEPEGVSTTLASVPLAGADLDGSRAGLSDDGQLVGFTVGFEGPAQQIFVWDAVTGAAEIVSTNTDGQPGEAASSFSVLAADGESIAYTSLAADLGPSDLNEFMDVYARPLLAAPEATPEPTATPGPTGPPLEVTAALELAVEFGGDDLEEVGAGAAEVEIAQIPPEAIPLTFGDIDFAPVRNIDLATAPVRNIPVRNIGFEHDLVRAALDTVLLSSVPTSYPGGWEAVLAGTGLDGVPLQTITLGDVFGLTPLPGPLDPASSVAPLELGALDLSASPVRNIGLASIALGATPLEDIPIQGPSDSVLENWCALLSDPPISCTDPTTLADTTLVALDIAGAPVRNIPVRNIPIHEIDLSAAPVRNIPVRNIELDASPVRNIPVRNIMLASTLAAAALDTIPVRNIALSASPVRNIPLSEITELDLVVDCSVAGLDCTSASVDTLGDAADVNAVRDSATLGDIGAALGDIPLGDLLVYGDVTIGDIIPGLPPEITLRDILIMLLDVESYPWEELPLDEMGVQDFARAGGQLEYDLDFELVSESSGRASAQISLNLPTGFRPQSRDEWFLTGGDGETEVLGIALDPPTIAGSTVTFSHGDLPVNTLLTLTIPVRPGLQLGPFEATATVTPGGAASSATDVAVTVVETFEPNDDPASAPSLDEGVLYISHITSADDLDFFRIPAPAAGSRITVRLSHLSDDNDLVVYSPAGSNLRAASPRSIGVQGSAVEDYGIDLDTLDDSLAPETLQDVPLVLPNVASVSATRLAGDETVEAVSLGGSDFYTIQVSGYNGATSDQPYVLRVEIDDPITLPACVPRVLPEGGAAAGAIPALPADLNTIFLVHQERLGNTFGAAAQAQVMTALGALASRGDLDVVGAVVPVEGSPAVATAFNVWDANPCDPLAANGVVNAIGALIDAIRADRPTLEHVVLIGGDDLIPMARVPDLTTLANERDYASTFADGNNQYLGAFATEHILSDDPYVDFDPIPFLDRHLFLPDLAIGRLVETPAEIVAAVDTFIDFEGRLDPQTALTTGYDFLADGAADVSGALSTATGATAHLLVTEDWDRAELLANFLPSGGVAPDVASINAHYDHNRSLPALGNSTADESDLFTTGDVDAAGLSLLGRILFTMGCHAGLSVSDVIVGAAVPNAPDWAQTFAAHDAAAFVANTGYGYGDTAAVAYSERLMTLFAERLNGTMSIGEALTFAKQEYFAGLALVGVYDEKAMTEAAFYGLPMYRIGAAAAPPAPPAPPATSTDPITGLEAAELVLEPAFTLQNGPTGDYYEANLPGSASHVQVTHYRPVQPRIEVDVTQPDAIAHDALITDLTQAPDEVLDPAYSRPIVDLAANEPETSFGEATFPSRLQGLVTYNAPDGQRQRLVVVPGQFFTDPGVADGLGVQRRFTEVDALVMYTDDQSTDFVRPVIRQVGATTIGTTVSFDVEANDADGATAFGIAEAPSIARVLVLFRHEADPLAWTPVDLVNTPGTNRWTGGATVLDSAGNPVPSADIAYFIQAVDASGNVGVSTNKGSYFASVDAPATTPEGVTVEGPTTDGSWYNGTVTVGVEGVGQFSRSIEGGAPADFDGSFTVTDDGVHDVEILRDGAFFASLLIAIDTTPPVVIIDSPPDGARYTLGDPVTAAFRCIDALSGVASCAGSTADGATLDTSTVGSHLLTVEAGDVAGNASGQVTRGYAVTYPFSGFFSPVKNQPTVNVVRAGRGVPLKFSLSGDRGLDILATGSPSSSRVSCASDAPNDDVEVTVTAGTSSLSYDSQADQYVYVWKTEKTWRDTCRRITFTLDDGTTQSAVFRFD